MLTGKPKPANNPAHSKATYPPPTTSVFPGGLTRLNKSSEVIEYLDIYFNSDGLHPVHIIAKYIIFWKKTIKNKKKLYHI